MLKCKVRVAKRGLTDWDPINFLLKLICFTNTKANPNPNPNPNWGRGGFSSGAIVWIPLFCIGFKFMFLKILKKRNKNIFLK